MTIATATAAAKTIASAGDAVLDTIKTGNRFHRYFDERRHGVIAITHPQHLSIFKAPDTKGWINISGTHERTKDKYWILTVSLKDDKYWIHGSIDLKPGGQWEESINVNARPGPRAVVVCLARLDPFADSLFSDIKQRARAANNHEAVHIIGIPNKSLRFIQSLTLNIP